MVSALALRRAVTGPQLVDSTFLCVSSVRRPARTGREGGRRLALTSAVMLRVLALALCAVAASAFYLPGIAPTDYDEGAPLAVLANKLVSAKNHVPYDFYKLPFCGAEDSGKSKRLSLGQVLMGERAEPTSFSMLMKVDEKCKVLCEKSYDAKQIALFRNRIMDDYNVRLNLDNLPVIVRGTNTLGDEVFQLGYPVGFHETGKTVCINNHLSFTVKYHQPTFPTSDFYSKNPAKVYRVVGFEVVPKSVAHTKAEKKGDPMPTCSANTSTSHMCFSGSTGSVIYTYDVQFVKSELQWATRWDPLLKANPELKEIQWFSIINSLMISLFLTAMVAMILLRTVYLDFARYNNIDDDEEIQEESGWKLIHGDVFRPPPASGLLSVLIGSGAQIICQTAVTLLFALLGFLSPANRGGLLTAMLTLWVFSSAVCGYFSARVYSGLGGTNKKSVTLGSAFLFSGSVFVIFFALNLLLWVSGSTGAVPFLTLLLLVVMWFGISVPLNVIGAFIGYKQKAYEFPVRTNQIPREIPNGGSNVSNLMFSLFSGILPFGTVFLELVFILNVSSFSLLVIPTLQSVHAP